MKPVVNILIFIGTILSLILYGLTIVSAYGGYINPVDHALPSMMLLAFPVLIAATIVVGIVWTILRQFKIVLLTVVVVAVCSPQILAFSPINFNTETIEQGEKTLKVLTYNIYYGRDWEKKDSVSNRCLSYAINSNADIVCLQELCYLRLSKRTVINQAQIDSLKAIYPYIVETKGIDVMVLSKYPIEHIPHAGKRDYRVHRHEAYRVDVDGNPLTLINVHLTSFSLRDEQLEVVENLIANNVEESAKEMKDSVYFKLSSAFKKRAICAEALRACIDTIPGDMIVCGDFNDITSSWAYRIVSGEDMRDAYRDISSGPIITYHANSIPFHIDHILYRGNLQPVSFGKGTLKSSDHYPIYTVFKFTKKQTTNITNQNLHNETQNFNPCSSDNAANANV